MSLMLHFISACWENSGRILRSGGVVFLVTISPVHANTLIWEGDVDANWNTNAGGTNSNWAGDVLPALSGDQLQFGAAGSSGSLLSNDIASLSLAGLSFAATAPAYTLSGLDISLTGTLLNSAANLQTVNFGISLGGNSAIQAAGGALTVGGAITSAGADLSLSGTQVLSLSGGLTFSSISNKMTSTATDLSISGGVSMAADVLVSGGTTRLISGTQSYSNGLKVDGSGSVLTVEGAAVTVNGIGGSSSLDVDSLNIGNGGSLDVKSGSLDVTPSRVWLQTGSINVTGGTLSINNALFAQSPTAVSAIHVSAGTLTVGNANRFANNGSATLTVSGTGAVTWATNGTGLSENGTGHFVMNGGTLNITNAGVNYMNLNGGNSAGANTAVVSSITLNAGVLSTRGFAMSAGANSTNRLAELRFNGGTLRATDNNGANNFIPASVNLTSIVKSGGAVIDTNGFNITIADALEHDSALGGSADGGLSKSGTGTLTLSGANSYTGGTVLNAGTVAVVNNTGAAVTYAGLVSGSGGLMTVAGNNTVNFSGGFSMTDPASTLTVTAADARINGNGTYNAAVTASGGGVIQFQTGTQSFTKGLVASGAGSTLSFEGVTMVHSGSGDGNGNNGLQLDNGGVLNVSAGSVTFNNSNRAFIQTSTIRVTGGSLTINNALFAQGTGTVSAVNVSSGSLALGGNVRFANNGTATLTVSGTGSVTWARGSYGLSENGTGNVVMNGGALDMTNSGTSYFYLNGGNQPAFNTAVVSSLELNAGVLSARGFDMNTSANATNRLAEIRFNGGTLQAKDNNSNFVVNSANLASTVQSGGAVIDSNTYAITYADALEHDSTLGAAKDGGLQKIGAGTLTLNNVNSYTGQTLVTTGTLALSSATTNNNIASSSGIEVGSGAVLDVSAISTGGGFQLASGQSLAGSGTVTGNVTASAGQIKPGSNDGAEDGTLSFSNHLTFTPVSASTVATLSVQGTTTANETGDRVQVAGALTLNSNSQVVVAAGANWSPTNGQSWTLMDWGGLLTLNGWDTGTNFRDGAGDDASMLDLPNISGIGLWEISDLATGSLVITIVPEPSRVWLLVVGACLVGGRRRRRFVLGVAGR